MDRRDFLSACAAAAFSGATPGNAAGLQPRFYVRTRLLQTNGEPVRAGSLAVGRNYIFHYPFEGTPCFLIKLGRPADRKVALRTEDGASYEWPGGVGREHDVVGYSAICSHKLTYPTRQISFISYRGGSGGSEISKPNTIHCCSEHSQYDPASGARVVNGPAPQPLAAILLEHDPASDGLYALGTLGGELFNAFFSKYELKLEIDYGSGRARRRVGTQTVVTELTSFCKQQVRC